MAIPGQPVSLVVMQMLCYCLLLMSLPFSIHDVQCCHSKAMGMDKHTRGVFVGQAWTWLLLLLSSFTTQHLTAGQPGNVVWPLGGREMG